MIKKILILNGKDNVGVVLEDFKEGDYTLVKDKKIVAKEAIEFGHKIALKNLAKEDAVCKYGEEIGYAIKKIDMGQWVHKHNMGCRRGK